MGFGNIGGGAPGGGAPGPPGQPGQPGQPGKSAYQIWLEEGNAGSVQDFLNSLVGEDGKDGEGAALPNIPARHVLVSDGTNIAGEDPANTDYQGESIRRIVYTEDDIQEGDPSPHSPGTLTGVQGVSVPSQPGKSAYQVWLDEGNTGTIEDFLNSIKGPDGPSIELQTTSTHIQWRVAGASTWTNLISLESLEGPPGPLSTIETIIEVRDDDPPDPVEGQLWIIRGMVIPARIVSTVPATLTESLSNDGSLTSGAIVITIAGGVFVSNIAKSDVASSNLPVGFDYTVTRNSDTQITITIIGAASNRTNVNNVTFTIAQAKVNGAFSNLTTPNISIIFNGASGGTSVVADDFTGANGSAINSANWDTIVNGTSNVTIQNNKARLQIVPSGNMTWAYFKTKPNAISLTSGEKISVEAKFSTTDPIKLFGYVISKENITDKPAGSSTNHSNALEIFFQTDNNSVYYQKKTNNVISQIVAQYDNAILTDGTEVTVKLITDGSSLEVYLNGTQIRTASGIGVDLGSTPYVAIFHEWDLAGTFSVYVDDVTIEIV